jgi:hypothetical protein
LLRSYVFESGIGKSLTAKFAKKGSEDRKEVLLRVLCGIAPRLKAF